MRNQRLAGALLSMALLVGIHAHAQQQWKSTIYNLDSNNSKWKPANNAEIFLPGIPPSDVGDIYIDKYGVNVNDSAGFSGFSTATATASNGGTLISWTGGLIPFLNPEFYGDFILPSGAVFGFTLLNGATVPDGMTFEWTFDTTVLGTQALTAPGITAGTGGTTNGTGTGASHTGVSVLKNTTLDNYYIQMSHAMLDYNVPFSALSTNQPAWTTATYLTSNAVLFAAGAAITDSFTISPVHQSYIFNYNLYTQATNGGVGTYLMNSMTAYTTNNQISMPNPTAESTAVLALNPLIYLPLNETNLPVATKSAAANLGVLGSRDNGTYTDGAFPGVPGALTGDSDTAALFSGASGSNPRVFAPYDASYASVTTFTVEAWINSPVDDPVGNCIAGCFDAGTRNGWNIFTGGAGTGAGSFLFTTYYGNGSSPAISYSIPVPGGHIVAGTWYHLAVTYNGASATAQGYVNGQLTASPVTSTTVPTYTTSTAGPFTVGAGSDASSPFPGFIDEVALYASALSPSDIASHYAAGTGGVASAYRNAVLSDTPLLYYRMDDSAAPVATNYGTAGAFANGYFESGTLPGSQPGPNYPGLGGTNSLSCHFSSAQSSDTGPSVAVLGATGLSVGTTTNDPITVTAWVQASTPSWLTTVLGTGDQSYHFDLDQGTGDSHFNVGNNTELTGSNVADGNWHFVAGTWDGTNMQSLYIDGVLKDTSPGNDIGNGNPFQPLLIGTAPDSTGRNFDGNICQVAVFPTALSSAAIAGLYLSSGVTANPIISTQPQSATAPIGANVTLSATAEGYQPLSYQWYKNSVAIPGANSSSLTINDAQSTSAGVYYVVVADGQTPVPGQTTSSPATLNVMSNCLQVVCSPDKTVACGAAWNFDPPTVSSCCPSNFVTSTGVATNVLVTALTPVINGVCPQYTVTETWLISDGCGDTNSCSQVVTVNCCTNNSCISLQCPSNIVVQSCTNVALNYSAIASDSCCSNLSVQYNPPSGSLFAPGTVTTVTVTAADPCNNFATCSFTVTVNSGGGLQVQCATNKTVACGSVWSFDTPVASSCCPNFSGTTTNLAVSVVNTVTNGVCPQVAITQTWAITDSCGDSNSCSQTVTVVGCCTNTSPCCGPNLGPQTIHWLPLPTNGTVNPNGLGLNTNNTWIVTNLPCYGNVLITQDFPDPSPSEVVWFLNPDMVNVPNAYGMFNFTETGYGPYSWGTGSWLDFLNDSTTPVNYSVNFYFLDGQPNPCTLYLGVAGLGQNTTATVSQTVAFRTEYDLFANAPGGDGYASADTTLNGVIPSPSGTTGTVVGSAYNINSVGDPQNTGWAVLQPTSGLAATNLPSGSGHDVNGNTFPSSTGSVPYMTLAIHQGLGDGIGFTMGYVCCGPCLTVQCATNKTVPCGSVWSFDSPVVSSCCPNFPGTTTNIEVVVTGTVTNGVCPLLVTRTWLITDSCGTSNTCSQTVTLVDTTPPVLTCSSNKTVQCGTTWSFNAPTAVDPCSGANLPLNFTTTTNGVCPKIFTRTWTAINLCGLSNSCSQQVTQVDTTPPVVNCHNYYPFGIIVPLNTNCYMVIPRLSPPPAYDNCTPPNQLIYTQSPPAGTMYYGAQSVVVTVTVTDLCGNSAQCHVVVTGMGRIGPVLTAPATVTVTNCVVPCVLPLVSATDCSCPPGSLHYTQSPPCGTVLGPGQNTVIVTVTDCHGLSASKVIHLVITGSISFLSNLYNTGVVPPALLPNLASDTHYSLVSAPVPLVAPVAGSYSFVPYSLPPLHSYSDWIIPDYDTNQAGANDPAGVYKYQLPFTLPAGVALNSVSISGRWAADNGGGLYLNGSASPVSVIPQPYGFANWTYFTIPPTAPYVAGANVLYFVVTNDSSYTALRVEFTNAVANCQDCVPPTITHITPPTTEVVGGSVTLQVTAGGTPPFGYQWYHNGVPIAGATSSSLSLNGLTYASSGGYEVAITNGCGQLEGYTALRIVPPWYWWWAWWNVPLVTSPLAANYGPDLMLVGTNSTTTNNAVTAGTTDDFGLPEVGGQVANVMHVGPLTPDTSILIPQITPAGSNSVGSYSVLMDTFRPDATTKLNDTLFASEACCIGSPANGVALVLDAQNNLHITGSADGSAFDFVGSTPFDTNSWNRIALVVDNPFADGTASNQTDVTVSLYLDGQYIGGGDVPTTNGLPVDWSSIPPSILSAQNTDGLYATDIQFHSVAIGSDLLAEMGSPDSGPIPLSTPVMTAPALNATQANGVITISWIGTSFALQETTEVSDGGTGWVDSTLPFTETAVSGGTQTSATAKPSPQAPAKFYRLVFRP